MTFVASTAIQLPVGRRSASAMANVATTTHAPCCSTAEWSRRDALCGRGLSFCLRPRRGENRVKAGITERVRHPLSTTATSRGLNKRPLSFFLVSTELDILGVAFTAQHSLAAMVSKPLLPLQKSGPLRSSRAHRLRSRHVLQRRMCTETYLNK